MASSTFWQNTLEKFKDYIETGSNVDAFFISGSQNMRDLRTTYQSLGSIAAFLDYLERKAQVEAAGAEQGAAFFSLMGGF